MKFRDWNTETSNINLETNLYPSILEKNKRQNFKRDIIPKGINKIIRFELFWLKIWIAVLLILFLTTGTWLGITVYTQKSYWSYIVPSIVTIIVFIFIVLVYINLYYLKKDIDHYRENISLNIYDIPYRIKRLYIIYFLRQTRHNWIIIFLFTYVGTSILLLWLLKDFSWWIFTFDLWVESLSKTIGFKTNTLLIILGSILTINVIYYIVATIQRKIKTKEFEHFYGKQLNTPSEVIQEKRITSKRWRNIYIISLIITIIIPYLIIKIIKRLVIKKRK